MGVGVCVSDFISELLCYKHFTDRCPDKVVLDPAEEVAPGDEEHGPDEDHADLVQDSAGCG